MAPELFELLTSMNDDDELSKIPYERIWKEMEKSLLSNFPDKFFLYLKDFHLLKRFMPEIDALDVDDMHDGTALIHTLNLLYHGNKSIDDKIMLLCHDFGKGVTDKSAHPKHHGHDKLGISEVELFCKRLKVSNKLKELALNSTKYHMVMKNLKMMRIGKCFKLIDTLKDDFVAVSRISFIDSAFRDGGDIPSSFQDHKDRCIYFQKYLHTINTITGKRLLKSDYEGTGKRFGLMLFNQRVHYFKKLINE
jgi:hypothetical protein